MDYTIIKKADVTIINPSDNDDIIEFKVTQAGVVNKTNLVMEHLKNILIKTNESQKYFDLIKKFKIGQDKDLIYKNIGYLISIADSFTDNYCQLDFSSFVNKKKKTRGSIMVDELEVKKMYLLTCILKLYMPFSSSNLIKYEDKKIHRYFFKYILEKMELKDLLLKLYDLVSRKIFRSSGLDPMMLEVLRMKSIQKEEDFALTMFDFILSSILVIYDMERNPVTFMVTSVDSMTDWYFRDLYNKAIVYKEAGDLFDISKVSSNIIEKILNEKILEVIEKYVNFKLKETGCTLTEIVKELETISLDEPFYNFFILPLFSYVFNVKQSGLIKLSSYNKVIIQLLFYFTIKTYNTTNNTDETFDFINAKDSPFLEIFKRIAVFKNETDDENTVRYKKKKVTYQLTILNDIFTSNFKFYGISNMRILSKYIKTVMTTIGNVKYFLRIISDEKKHYNPNKKKMIEIEKKIFPYAMVILDESNELKVPEMISLKNFIRDTIRKVEAIHIKNKTSKLVNINNNHEKEKEI